MTRPAVISIRLRHGRQHLHGRCGRDSLLEARNAYRALTVAHELIGNLVTQGGDAGRRINVTPGQVVLEVPDISQVHAHSVYSLLRSFLDIGLEFSVRHAVYNGDSAAWGQWVHAWLTVVADSSDPPRRPELVHIGTTRILERSLDAWRAQHESRYEVSTLECRQCSGPDPILDSTFEQLVRASPGVRHTYMRVDVRGTRDLLRSCTSREEFDAMSARLTEWFRHGAHRVIHSVSPDMATSIGSLKILHSEADDAVLVGPDRLIQDAREAMAKDFAANCRVGDLQFGSTPLWANAVASTLAARARSSMRG